MWIDPVSMFQFPKFLGEYEWPNLTHMPSIGTITKGMSSTSSGVLAGNVLQKGAVGKMK